MNQLVRILSSSFDDAKRRVVKFIRMGKADVQTSIQAAPYGIDSSPIQNIRGVYVQTSTIGKTYIVGYLNVDQKAEPGEFRTYATNSTGTEVFYTWMKTDGTMEIGGAVHNLVRYTPLNTGLQNQNTLISTNLTAILTNLTQLNVAINTLDRKSVV
jgi:hypothetical protein